jgi:hypothetical protein
LRRESAKLVGRPVVLAALGVVVASSTLLVLTVPNGSHHAAALSARARGAIGRNETTQILAREHGAAAKLPRASGAPPSLSASVADSPPMKPHEEFGFAPYWTLDQATSFDVSELTTIAYFALDVNPNGTISRSGTGWDGYESQPFENLVARAHAAGDRVVLSVDCFAQSALDSLTSSASAASTLAAQVVVDMKAKNLDGVNLDFEGVGSADQRGLTALAATVARAVHAVNPHDQVTMDTYASSAGDPNGFFNIPALAKVVNGFFVMDYDLNFDAARSSESPLTSTEFPDALAAAQYAAAVPPLMVILGASFYGYEWPTTNGTLDASAVGAPTPVSYAQAVSSGPVYWDRVTQTAWSSFETAGQWHETFFEDPESIYLLSQLARRDGFGTGAWALGMQGGDARMLAALDGVTPGTGTGWTGPAWTSQSVAPRSGSGGARGASTTRQRSPATQKSGVTPPPSSTTSTTTTAGSTTTTVGSSTTTTSAPTSPGPYYYSGVVESTTVTLTKVANNQLPSGTATLVGTLTSFRTNDPSLACLETTPAPMDVWQYPGSTDDVVTARTPASCATASFEFPASDIPAPSVAPSSSP